MIINLFPSCFSVSGVNQKHEEKYNRTVFGLHQKLQKQDGNKFIILN